MNKPQIRMELATVVANQTYYSFPTGLLDEEVHNVWSSHSDQEENMASLVLYGAAKAALKAGELHYNLQWKLKGFVGAFESALGAPVPHMALYWLGKEGHQYTQYAAELLFELGKLEGSN